MEIFKIQNLSYYYPENKRPALKDINLSIENGDSILLLGESGSGKSTLGRIFNGIVPEFYGGTLYGEVKGDTRTVGMVFQDPEKQLIMDKVKREIAFGLENLGTEYSIMRKRVMETLSFLNIEGIKNQNTYELSSGQKQKVAIGTALAMGHLFIVFDEPISQLDPAAADEIIHVIERLNKELGYTIILIEQRIDRCFHLADRVLFMKDGEISFDGTPEEFTLWSRKKESGFLPSVSGFFALSGYENLPSTIKDGRKRLLETTGFKSMPERKETSRTKEPNPIAVKLEKVYLQYDNGIQAINNMDLEIEKNEVVGVIGPNGSGKTTLLKIISGLLKPSSGKIVNEEKTGYLSQNPNDYLFNNSVYEELKFTLDINKIEESERIESILEDLNLVHLKDKNPRDLSGGEKQRVALSSILVSHPGLILLDEPTRGLDRRLKDVLGQMLKKLQINGKTIIIVTHDIEFVAKYCTKACLVNEGTIVENAQTYQVLSSGFYYTTQMKKLFHGLADGILTIEDALRASSNLMSKI